MTKVILYRLLQFPLILAVIYFLTFLLCWVAPGDPFSTERNMSETVRRSLQERFHAESPWKFLAYYPRQILFHGDLGPSMQQPEWSVNDIVGQSLPVSVTLGLFALVVGTVVGVGLGTLAAVRRGGVWDWLSLSLALIGISLPSFVVAAVVLMGAAASHRLPVGGWGRPVDVVLPGLALALAPMAYIARLTRVAMLDVLGADYVRTARAKGLGKSLVVWKHCLRNAFLPVLSYLGPAAAATLTGSFVVEKVFNIPGLGQHFVNSVLNRDQTLILGVVLVYSLFLLSLNLLVDVAYAWVDPRIEVDG
ncbi:MAG: ABC-type transporter, integral rane subunit [Phycisphaerales bacterium]|nr:ABC-type transporter, integral rane subunit [Phycisphaerales bacterium]